VPNGPVPSENEVAPAEPLYDPERVAFEDLDLTDADVVMAYLHDPATHVLYEDTSREFRRLPEPEQECEISKALDDYNGWRRQVAAALDAHPEASPAHDALVGLLKRLDDSIDVAKLRLFELKDEE